MARIVLGFDGTPASVAALRWTAARCARRTAVVDVVNVKSQTATDPADGLRLLAHAEDELREQVPGLEIELHRLEGVMPRALAEFAQGADLVVIGISAGHQPGATLDGFVPLRLAIDSTAPVCMVPSTWMGSGEPVTVGVAADGSSEAALEFAADEAASTDRSLRVVHAWLMPTPTGHDAALKVSPDEVEAAHRRQVLDRALAAVRRERPLLTADAELIRDSTSAALLRFATASSLMVIGSHHRGPSPGSLLGPVAQELLSRADCPVCVVPGEKGHVAE